MENEKVESQQELLEGEVIEIPEGSTFTEQLLRSVILGYQDAFNKDNKTHEVKYIMTITTHKVATKDGNKDVAYLRIDKYIRDKDETSEDKWEHRHIVHQEHYIFSGIAERVNPKAKWKEQLYVNALARLTAAGLEYAELLQRLKQREDAEKLVASEQSKIEVTSQMPTPLTQEDEKYKQWLTEERKKEGLTN